MNRLPESTHVRIHEDPLDRAVYIFIFDRDPSMVDANVLSSLDTGADWIKLETRDRLALDNATARIPTAVWALIMAEATQQGLGAGPIENHLDDALDVRDRLLTLVEGMLA